MLTRGEGVAMYLPADPLFTFTHVHKAKNTLQDHRLSGPPVLGGAFVLLQSRFFP